MDWQKCIIWQLFWRNLTTSVHGWLHIVRALDADKQHFLVNSNSTDLSVEVFWPRWQAFLRSCWTPASECRICPAHDACCWSPHLNHSIQKETIRYTAAHTPKRRQRQTADAVIWIPYLSSLRCILLYKDKGKHGSYYSAEYIFPDFSLTFQNKMNCFPWLICSCEIPMLAFNRLQ